jgi:hypothetical protein
MVVAHGNGGQDQTSLNPYVPIHQPFAVPICALVGPAHGYRQGLAHVPDAAAVVLLDVPSVE